MNNFKLAVYTNDPETLDRLSYNEDWYVRRNVACNLNTPPETLKHLSYDENYAVRFWVAKNLNTSPETLERLFYDKSWGVLWGVLRNPNTPQYIKDSIKFKEYLRYYEQF